MDLAPTCPTISLDGTSERMAVLVASFPCLAGLDGTQPFAARALILGALDQEETSPDARAAGEFLVWLWVEGLREAGTLDRLKHVRELHVADRFSLSAVAFYGSPKTRAAVAAWLVDPWLPCATG
jgi:hypothetical protein